MNVFALLLSAILCAVNWLEPDGVTVKNEGQYLWPPDKAAEMVKFEQDRDPTQQAEVVCKEQ